MDQATREIMWNIPTSFKIAMYAMLAIATVILIKGLIEKYQIMAQGASPAQFFKGIKPTQLNWKSFWETIFFQGRVVRDRRVAVFHSLIFYGFFILWIATDLVAIHFDTPFKVFKGPVYIVVSFLADIAGLAILLGLALAYKRRYIEKPSYLQSTNPKRELYMYGILVALVVLGFFLEGLRILGTGMPAAEMFYSPVGWVFAQFFGVLSLSETSLATTYRVLWFLHMVNTMLFVATIPYSKFFHIVLGPLNALLTPLRRSGVMAPMDFEDESKETFGLGLFSELSFKNRMDTMACVECGRCTQACPANRADRPLDPKMIITKLRDRTEEKITATSKEKSTENTAFDFDFWNDESPIYNSVELDSCTTCGACVEECPMSIEHLDLILNLKRYKALTLGDLPPAAADAANKVRVNGNPWGISQDDRMKWADGLDVPVASEGEKIDYLYYVGCAGSYDASNQKVVQDTVKLLMKAGVKFAVMGKTEKCNGDPIRRFGDEYTFTEIAIENIANLRKYSFDKVVTHCPHCLHTIGKEYAKFEDGEFETVHHTELLAQLLREGKLAPKKSVDETLTFHDPCYLGRHHGEYDAPRDILKAIPGLNLEEMEESKDRALCCGMGGGNMWYEVEEGENLAEKRLEHVAATKTQKLATSCSYCMINFNSSKGTIKQTEELEVEDVAQILAKSIE